MTKKHFKALAKAISLITNEAQRADVSFLIGRVCTEDNPRFDWDKWNEACQVKAETK